MKILCLTPIKHLDGVYEYLESFGEVDYKPDLQDIDFDMYGYDVIEDSYIHVIKIYRHAPCVALRMAENVVLFNHAKEKEPLTSLGDHCHVVVLVEFVGLKFLRTSVKPEFAIVQIKLNRNEDRIIPSLNRCLILDPNTEISISEKEEDLEYEKQIEMI